MLLTQLAIGRSLYEYPGAWKAVYDHFSRMVEVGWDYTSFPHGPEVHRSSAWKQPFELSYPQRGQVDLSARPNCPDELLYGKVKLTSAPKLAKPLQNMRSVDGNYLGAVATVEVTGIEVPLIVPVRLLFQSDSSWVAIE